jgi:hypothetical protein
MPRTRSRFFVMGLLLSATTFGCGGDSNMAPVSGKVLLDGQPLTQGWVTTLPAAGRGARGLIQPDGSFVLGTDDKSDGAVIGLHQVAVTSYAVSADQGPESGPGKLLVPEEYVSPSTSELTIDVKADGDNNPVLELTSK